MNRIVKNGGWSAVVAAALSVLAAGSAGAQSFDFETPGQYQNNFRQLFGQTSVGAPATAAQSDNGAANDYVTAATNTAVTTVYDATPVDGAVKSTFTVSQSAPLTVSADVRLAGGGSSIGFYVVDASDESKGYLALFNIDQNANGDLIRFSGGANPGTGGAAGLNSGKSGEGLTTGTFGNLTLTYSIDPSNHPVLTLAADSLSDSVTFSTVTNPLTTVEVGIRDSAQAGGPNDFDNFTVTSAPTPEPSSLALLVLAAVPLVRRRRRNG